MATTTIPRFFYCLMQAIAVKGAVANVPLKGPRPSSTTEAASLRFRQLAEAVTVIDMAENRRGAHRWAMLLLTLGPAALSAGCGTIVGSAVTAANRIDQARDQARRSDLATQHLDHIKELQAKGDPLGDYLWAEANEKQIVPNAIQDPATIRQLYLAAADKGSVDAQLVLAVKQFKEGEPRHFNHGRTPEEMAEKEPVWSEGLSKIDNVTQQRCFFYYTYIFAPQQKRCLTPRIAADIVWPGFRDGYTYPKNSALRDLWYDKAIACEQTAEYQEATKRCRVFGDDNYRFKGKD